MHATIMNDRATYNFAHSEEAALDPNEHVIEPHSLAKEVERQSCHRPMVAEKIGPLAEPLQIK